MRLENYFMRFVIGLVQIGKTFTADKNAAKVFFRFVLKGCYKIPVIFALKTFSKIITIILSNPIIAT